MKLIGQQRRKGALECGKSLKRLLPTQGSNDTARDVGSIFRPSGSEWTEGCRGK